MNMIHPTQSWNAKISHSLCTSKGFNGCCTVATIESGIAAITITSSQLHNYTCCKLIPILQYGDEFTLYYSHIFQHYSRVILAPGYLYYAGNYARIMDSSLAVWVVVCGLCLGVHMTII